MTYTFRGMKSFRLPCPETRVMVRNWIISLPQSQPVLQQVLQ